MVSYHRIAALAVLVWLVLVGSAGAALVPTGTFDVYFMQNGVVIASAKNVPLPDPPGMTAGSLQQITWADYDAGGNVIAGTEWTVNGHPVKLSVYNHEVDNNADPGFAYVQWYVKAPDAQGQPQPLETLLIGENDFSVQIADFDFENDITVQAVPQLAANLYMLDPLFRSYKLPGATLSGDSPPIYQIPNTAMLPGNPYGYSVRSLDLNGSFVIGGIGEPDETTEVYEDGSITTGSGNVWEISWGMGYQVTIPEPATIVLMALAAAVIGVGRRW